MSVNKVVYSGKTLIDLTGDTVTADSMLSGITGHDRAGNPIIGTMEPGVTPETPSITVSSSGLITATANGLSKTQQLTTQAAKTVTPTNSSQTAVASGRYTTGAVKVAAIPSEYIIPSGTMIITENGTHDVSGFASASVNVPSGGADTPDVMTIYANSSATLSTSSVNLTLGGSISSLSSGSALTKGTNCITVTKAGKILVSGNCEATGVYRGDQTRLRIFAGSTLVSYCGMTGGYASSGTTSLQITMSLTPRIVEVAANTQITLRGQNQNSARGSYGSSDANQTWLTVQYIG